MASSVTAFAVASFVFFTIGLLLGYYLHKKRYNASDISSTGEEAQQVTDDNETDPNQELQLDLKDNVAYGPSQPIPVYEDVLYIRASASAVDYDQQHEDGQELRENVAYCGRIPNP